MSSKSIIQNSPFGNIFTKGGKGKKKFGGKNVTQFLKKILGNRVFDLYLKYLGIASLTTSTLVPFGLVLSAEYADKIIKKKSLGKFDKSRIPILDNSMIGNYLKIAGLSLLELTPATLLPLGVIMIIYELGIKNLLKQTGGRLSIGSTIPPNFVQKIDAIVSGQTGAGLFEAYDLLNPKLQQECGGGACGPNNITKPHDFRIKAGKVKGFKNNKTPQADSIHEIKFVKNSDANIDPTYKGNDKVLHLMAGGSASGKKQTGGKNVYTKIVNPKTGRKVSITGALGKSIVKNYLSFLNGGSVIQDATFSLSRQEATHALELCDRKLSQFYKKQFGGAAPVETGEEVVTSEEEEVMTNEEQEVSRRAKADAARFEEVKARLATETPYVRRALLDSRRSIPREVLERWERADKEVEDMRKEGAAFYKERMRKEKLDQEHSRRHHQEFGALPDMEGAIPALSR